MNIWVRNLIWLAVAGLVCLGVWRLESERAQINQSTVDTTQGQVALYHSKAQPMGPLVVVTHGFAGSVQLMQTISRDLARAGFTVAAFDFLGHGRSALAMSADISRIEGTTAQLVAQTKSVVQQVRAHTGVQGPIALVGHSMATDVIVRAARDIPDVTAVAAISMYSDAVDKTHPQSLLILSGAYEGHLRAIALKYAQMIDPAAQEGETVQAQSIIRRAVAVPNTGHLTVLFHPVTLRETRSWLAQAMNHPVPEQNTTTGPWIALVLGGLVALIWPTSRIIPRRAVAPTPLMPLRVLAVAFVASVLAFGAGSLMQGAVLGFGGFRGLFGFFAVWGVTIGIFLRDRIRVLGRPSLAGGSLLLVWGIGVFAFALDRYGAAFVPTGPRLSLAVVLALATIPFAVADRVLNDGSALWVRVVNRGIIITALAGIMIATSGQMMLLFTVLPVLILFFLVYGSMARSIEKRSDPLTSGVALGLCLAWAIAASTPLFQG